MADRGGRLKRRRTVTFEDPTAMAALLAPRRVALFMAISEKAGTIADVAARLGRSAHAVSRDVAFFAQLGIFIVDSSQEGVRGVHREVRAATDRLVLTCVIGR